MATIDEQRRGFFKDMRDLKRTFLEQKEELARRTKEVFSDNSGIHEYSEELQNSIRLLKEKKALLAREKELRKELHDKEVEEKTEQLKKLDIQERISDLTKEHKRLKKDTLLTEEERGRRLYDVEKALKEQNRLLGRQSDKIKGVKKDIKALKDEVAEAEENNKETLEEIRDLEQETNKLIAEEKKLIQWANEERESGHTIEQKINHLVEQRVVGYNKIKNGVSEVTKGFTKLVGLAKELTEYWRQVDHSSVGFARSIAGSAEMASRLRKETFEYVEGRKLDIQYGVNSNDLLSMQTKLSQDMGRDVTLDADRAESLAIMSRLVGDTGKTTEFVSNLSTFGMSVGTSMGRFSEMFEKANHTGLVMENYTKNFTQNLKMANSYSFRNGVRGLEEMARKATSIRLEMGQIAAFADKVSTVEGAVTTSAQLSVLGGTFARFASPMAMLNESLNDMNGLMDRVVGMYGDLGRFNAKTGEVEINNFDRQRVKAAAQAMGISSDEMFNMINRRAEQNEISRQMGGVFSNDAEMSDLIKNTAYIDSDGIAKVKLGNGKTKNVSDLTDNDKKSLQGERDIQKDAMADSARSLRSINDTIEDLKKTVFEKIAKFVEDIKLGERLDWIKDNLGLLGNIAKGIAISVGALLAIKTVNAGLNMVNGTINAVKGLSQGFRGGASSATASVEKSVGKSERQRLRTIQNPSQTIASQTSTQPNPNRLFMTKDGMRAGYVDPTTGKMVIGGSRMTAAKNLFKTGAAGGLGMGLLSAGITGAMEFGGDNNHSTKNKVGKTAGAGIGAVVGGGIGAVLGSFLGVPQLGMIAGSMLGGWAGEEIGDLITGNDESRTQEAIKKMQNNYYSLNDPLKYSADELEAIANGRNAIGRVSGLSNKMERLGDALPAYHIGGEVQGNGEVNAKLLSKEYVVNPTAAQKPENKAMLERINNGENIIPTQPLGNQMNVSESNGKTSAGVGNVKVEIPPIDIKLDGSIKLDLGNGRTNDIDAKTIFNNQQFVNQLRNVIIKEVNSVVGRSFNKEDLFNKIGM